MTNPFRSRDTIASRGRGGGAGPGSAGPAGSPAEFWIDTTDISTLFQDLARLIPITANGQVIEAITDKGANGWHLDAPIVSFGGLKPIYQAVATGGLGAAAFDRSASSGNESGQQIRMSFTTPSIPLPYAALHVGNWQVPGAGFEGLFCHAVGDRAGGKMAGGALVTGGSPGQLLQQTSVDGDFASWFIDFDFLNSECSINGTAGRLITNSATAQADYVTNVGFSRLAIGGNQNGSAATGGWNGTISEHVVWQGNNIPTPDAIEAYVTGKYGLNWL